MHIFVYMLLILNINKKGSYEFSKSCYRSEERRVGKECRL